MYKVIITYELIFLAFWNVLYLSNSDVENWFTEKFLTAIFVFLSTMALGATLMYVIFISFKMSGFSKVLKNLKKHNHDSKHISSDYLGRCDSTEKIIYLNLDPEDWKIEMLMVHEICHAQKGCKSHGDQWKKKMQEAAYRCESIENFRLADQIRHEIENYSS